KKKPYFFFLVIFAQILLASFASCDGEKKTSYRIYVQINNNSGSSYSVSTSYNGKDSDFSMALKDGFVFMGELGQKSLSDSQIEQAVKDVKIQLKGEDGSIAVSQTFSFSDGFIVKKDLREFPARFQKNEIKLFLELTKGSNGELLLTPTKPEDADDL
ncbi:MAG: hypothetical protein II507_01790, partial [Treponema sp.]|nr:hypothetical protein [Treponema sp.]